MIIDLDGNKQILIFFILFKFEIEGSKEKGVIDGCNTWYGTRGRALLSRSRPMSNMG